MPTKTERDPTQSLWIENRYNRDLKKTLAKYTEGMIEIIESGDNVRERLDEYKAEQLKTVLKPLAEKYVELSLIQGKKYGLLEVKRIAKRR